MFDKVFAAGDGLGLKLTAGYHAMNSLRMERPTAIGGTTSLMRTLRIRAAWDLLSLGIRPEASLAAKPFFAEKKTGVDRRLASFALEDPTKLLYHNEPVLRDGKIVGRITSGMFGHTIGWSLGLGYVGVPNTKVGAEFVNSGSFEIEVAGQRVPAKASLKPFYDPAGLKVKDMTEEASVVKKGIP